ncbi:MAG: GntR family transcriptional regulator [Gemmatimonadota bacterium]
MSGRDEVAAAAVPIPMPLEAPDRTDGGALHGRIRRQVLQRILTGESGPGDRVSVSALAAETGISRTPVRESLLQLQREGFLTLEENRGFFVRPLTEREARELYPILHALEDLALATAGRASRARIERLEALNDRLAASRDAAEAIALNFAWHRQLTSPCANRELARLLDRYRMRVYRYEHAYYGPGEERVAYSVELHREILTALRAGDVRKARAVLERHWIGDYSLYLPGGAGGGAAARRGPASPEDGAEGGADAASEPDRS